MANTGQALIVVFTIQQLQQKVQVKVTLQLSTIITTSTCQTEASLNTMEYKSKYRCYRCLDMGRWNELSDVNSIEGRRTWEEELLKLNIYY